MIWGFEGLGVKGHKAVKVEGEGIVVYGGLGVVGGLGVQLVAISVSGIDL